MSAAELYKAGALAPAIEALGLELRKQPTDIKRRTFLFELLCFAGQYDRAAKQLDVLADLSKDAASGALLYRAALHAQRTREDMFECGEVPEKTSEPCPPGTVNGEPFEELEDEDPRFGACLEVYIAGSYTWVPFRYVERLTIPAPTRLRDLLWAPAHLTTTPDFRLQDLGEVLLPVLAPLSWKSSDDAVRLGRTTVIVDDAHFGKVPVGLKILLAGDKEYSLLDAREIEFQGAAPHDSLNAEDATEKE